VSTFSQLFIRIRLWLGLFCLSAGGVALAVAGDRWMLLWLAVGVALLVWHWLPQVSMLSRGAIVNTNALVTTGAILLIVIILNFLAWRYGARWDFTETKLFSLAPQSILVTRQLAQPLKIWIFDRELTPADRRLLDLYKKASSQIDYATIDVREEPGLARRLQVVRSGEVRLEFGSRQQLVRVLTPAEDLAEAQLTNAIERIQRSNPIKVYFTQGQGETIVDPHRSDIASALQALQDRDIQFAPLDLTAATAIPADASVLAIVGAKTIPPAAAIRAIEAYRQRGGSLFAAIAPNTDLAWNRIFQNWQIQFDGRIAIESSDRGDTIGVSKSITIVDRYGNSPVASSLQGLWTLMPLAHPVTSPHGSPLLITDPNNWAESDLTKSPLEFNPDLDLRGPLELGILVDNTYRAIVIGSADAIYNPPLQSGGRVANKDLWLNTISWLGKANEASLGIRPKTVISRSFQLSFWQLHILPWMVFLGLPILGIIGGFSVWWKPSENR
jgi:ABC-type uncharacterized transport system involved in gliding motility auxiliary subunit